MNAALARLATMHAGLNDIDPDVERVLSAQLDEARADLDRSTGGRSIS